MVFDWILNIRVVSADLSQSLAIQSVKKEPSQGHTAGFNNVSIQLSQALEHISIVDRKSSYPVGQKQTLSSSMKDPASSRSRQKQQLQIRSASSHTFPNA